MSVEDRLRRGLHANALAFAPESEQRLVEVRRRQRRRTGALAAAAAAAVVVIVAAAASLLWGSDRPDSPEPAPGPSQVTTSASGYAGPRIPDSTWRKVVTREQLVRAGADSAFLQENLGGADRIPTTLSFKGDVFSQRGRFPGGWAVGDTGTAEYDPGGRLVLSSASSTCPGCVSSLTWRIDGDRLVLGDFRGPPDDNEAPVMLEGVWTRVGP